MNSSELSINIIHNSVQKREITAHKCKKEKKKKESLGPLSLTKLLKQCNKERISRVSSKNQATGSLDSHNLIKNKVANLIQLSL